MLTIDSIHTWLEMGSRIDQTCALKLSGTTMVKPSVYMADEKSTAFDQLSVWANGPVMVD